MKKKDKEKGKEKEDVSQFMDDVIDMWQSTFPKIEDLLKEHNDRVSRFEPFKEEVILVRENGVSSLSCPEDHDLRNLLGRRAYMNNAEGFSEFLKDICSKDDSKDEFKTMGEVVHDLYCNSYLVPDDECFYKDEDGTLVVLRPDFNDDYTLAALERLVKFESLLLDYLLKNNKRQ